MNRFEGKVGYGIDQEFPPDSGTWKPIITEYSYYGDVVRNTRSLEDGPGLNDDISVGNSISVVADEYAWQNFHLIKYVWWNGVAWKVKTVDAGKAPRLILNLGEVYNGPFPEEED